MHIAFRKTTAIFEFEGSKSEKIEHGDMMSSIINISDKGFSVFIFDFKCVDFKFNSIVSGFIIVVIKKLSEKGKETYINNISWDDWEMLNTVGLRDLVELYPGKININISCEESVK